MGGLWMDPDEIQLRNTSLEFEYERMAREIDECDDTRFTARYVCSI